MTRETRFVTHVRRGARMSQSEKHEGAREALRKAEAYLRGRNFDAARRMVALSLRLHPGTEAAKRVKKAVEVQRVLSCDAKDHYEVLGVKREATADAIRKAYRDLSLFVHPDRNHGNAQAKEAFQRLEEANSTLSDAEKRRKYDAAYDRGRGKRRRPPTSAGDAADGKRARPADRPPPNPFERQRAASAGGSGANGGGAGFSRPSSGGNTRSPGGSRSHAELDNLKECLMKLERRKVPR